MRPQFPDNLGSSETSRLANAIFDDIRQSGFRPGERYLNGAEIADKYGVTLITANRALQSLAERNVLERRRRAGTFIAESFEVAEQPLHQLKCVHLLMPVTYFRFSRQSVEEALFGINAELPHVHIQHTFLPVSGELGFVRELLLQAQKGKSMEGVVLFVSSAEIQQFFRDARVPAVVFGSVFPETSELPWIDRDQKQIGSLLADFLVKEGHHRVGLLMRERWGFGDNLLVDGVQDRFGMARTGVSLRVRSLPSIEETMLSTIKSLLKSSEAPTALICRSGKLAAAAEQAALDLKIKVPKQLRIVVAESSNVYPSVVPTRSQEEQGACIGRMLRQLSTGKAPDPHNVLIPVKLHNPVAS